jgi:peptidoglycan hydrolase CwlO-like protein
MNEYIYTLIVALAGSAGFWSFMSLREKNKGNPASEYNMTLKSQIDGLAKRLDAKDAKIEQLLGEIANLRADLSAATVNISHLETLLRTR